jgi:hypothetical protein
MRLHSSACHPYGGLLENCCSHDECLHSTTQLHFGKAGSRPTAMLSLDSAPHRSDPGRPSTTIPSHAKVSHVRLCCS